MSPRFSFSNQANSRDSYSKLVSNFLKRQPGSPQCTYFEYLALFQFAHTVNRTRGMDMSQKLIGMDAIFRFGAIFQIAPLVVASISVFVIYLMLVGWHGTFKRKEDELMHHVSFFAGVYAESYSKFASLIGVRLKDLLVHPSVPSNFGWGLQSHNTSLIRSLIKTFVSGYVSPCFNWHGNIVTQVGRFA